MRTKVLCAAALAVGALTSMAQVYSANIVGYVNVNVPTGYSMMANPLDAGDNTVNNIFSAAVTAGTMPGNIVYTWDGSGLVGNACDEFDGTWQLPTLDLSPGKGFFMRNLSGSPFTVTFVGSVKQGALAQPSIATGYSVYASMIPVNGYLQTDLGLTNAAPGDIVYVWDGSGLVGTAKDEFDGTWSGLPSPFVVDSDKGPQISIGTSFFYRNLSGAPISWTFNFNP